MMAVTRCTKLSCLVLLQRLRLLRAIQKHCRPKFVIGFFEDCCVAAGILDKSGHGVRKAAATEAAENDATHAEA
jgi:hypothetical protein